jgi:lycopene cyclase domain-containing protein
MREYTLLAILSVFIVLALEAKLGMGLFKRKLFWVFLVLIIFFKLLVNGYLTGSSIVIYNPGFFWGVRVGSIPIEDFLFGFSMVSLTIMLWEYFKIRKI